MVKNISEYELLGYDPFAGDKDDGGWKHLRNEVVKLRKPAPCFHWEPHIIEPGKLAVRYTAVLPGTGWKSFVVCAECIKKDIRKYG